MTDQPAVIVALDGSTHALAALPVAAVLARLHGALLHLLHVANGPVLARDALERLGLRPDDARGAVLDQATGEPGAAIRAAATRSPHTTVVLSKHAGHPQATSGIGHVAEEALLGVPCPLVLVPPERGVAPWALRRVLLPYDGTPTTAAAACPAALLVQRASAALDVLHVCAQGTPPAREQGALAAPRYVDQPQHEWPAWAQEFVQRLTALCPLDPTHLRLSLAAGEPGAAIVRFAAEHESDLIVVACHPTREPGHAATVTAIVRDAPCPVMVLRAAAA
jgi:nucleotide-binding universal stress UspA family protein